MDFTIPEEARRIQSLTREFVQKELLPYEPELEEKDDLPDEVWRELVRKSLQLGLYNFPGPKEYGGGGIKSMLAEVLAREEMGALAHGFQYLVGNDGGVIARHGTADQKTRYTRRDMRGEITIGFGMTEPNAGADIGAIETRAARDGDNWVINGMKHYMTGADKYAATVISAVSDWEKRARGGVTMFIVEVTAPGFKVGRRQRWMGRAGCHSYELFFENCLVPDRNRLGPEGQGYRFLMEDVARGRFMEAAPAIGAAQRLLNLSVQHAKTRKQFGQRLGDFQAIQWMLADSATELDAARWMTYHGAWMMDQGMDARQEGDMAKLFAVEMAWQVADRAMQLHGGAGYCKDLPVEAIFRSVRSFRITHGSAEILRFRVARNLLRD